MDGDSRQIRGDIFLSDMASQQVTQLLRVAAGGDQRAGDDLLRLVYEELRRLAGSWLARTPPGQTLQPTALVHEAFIRLVGKDQQSWENRGHFFFAASRAMRDILVERARAKATIKRGGGRRRVSIEHLESAADAPEEDMLALDVALRAFESHFPWEHRIVMLRFFAGLTNEETAQAASVSLRTVERDCRFARAWLRDALSGEDSSAWDRSK